MDPTACLEAWVDAAHWFTAVFSNLDSFQEYGYGPQLSEFPTSMGIAGAEVPPLSGSFSRLGNTVHNSGTDSLASNKTLPVFLCSC